VTVVNVCRRKAMSEGQARLAAIRVGAKTGERWYPEYCAPCRAWHITKAK